MEESLSKLNPPFLLSEFTTSSNLPLLAVTTLPFPTSQPLPVYGIQNPPPHYECF